MAFLDAVAKNQNLQDLNWQLLRHKPTGKEQEIWTQNKNLCGELRHLRAELRERTEQLSAAETRAAHAKAKAPLDNNDSDDSDSDCDSADPAEALRRARSRLCDMEASIPIEHVTSTFGASKFARRWRNAVRKAPDAPALASMMMTLREHMLDDETDSPLAGSASGGGGGAATALIKPEWRVGTARLAAWQAAARAPSLTLAGLNELLMQLKAMRAPRAVVAAERSEPNEATQPRDEAMVGLSRAQTKQLLMQMGQARDERR